MIRRTFMKALGALGLGGLAAPAIAREEFEVRAYPEGGGPCIGKVRGEVTSFEGRLIAIRTGDRVDITILDGGVLNLPEGCKVDTINVMGGSVGWGGEPYRLVDTGPHVGGPIDLDLLTIAR